MSTPTENAASDIDALNTKLAPCPKCHEKGSPAVAYSRKEWHVECDTCGISTAGQSTPEAAAKSWVFPEPEYMRPLRLRFARALVFIDALGGWERPDGVFEMKPNHPQPGAMP